MFADGVHICIFVLFKLQEMFVYTNLSLNYGIDCQAEFVQKDEVLVKLCQQMSFVKIEISIIYFYAITPILYAE